MNAQTCLDLSALASEGQSAAANRSALYACFATAFAYPDAARFERLSSDAIWHDMRELFELLGIRHQIALKQKTLNAGSVTDLRVCYTALFDVCGGRPRVSLLERRYRERVESEQSLWEDLLRFYRHFGLDFATGRTEENPDHLLLQLEFMHYLSFLEAGAPPAQSENLQRAQRDFLVGHLGCWTHLLSAQLAKQANPGPYLMIAESLAAFVANDRAFLESQVGAGNSNSKPKQSTE